MKRILIVDDSMIMRMNLKKIFEDQGYEVIAEAANGQEAVTKYQKLRPDLTTMDITMPVLDGISALKEIRSFDKDACVVMISALGQEMKIIEALNSGARHYILKPFNENKIITMINDIINNMPEEYPNVSTAK